MIKNFYDYIKEDGSTSASVGSGTAVGSGVSSTGGNFTSAAGSSVSGGDSGSAFSTNSNTSGMGKVSSAQPSNIPGDVAGSTKGSGDISKSIGTFTKNSFKKDKKNKKKKETKKLKDNTSKLDSLDKLMVTSIRKFESFTNEAIQEDDIPDFIATHYDIGNSSKNVMLLKPNKIRKGEVLVVDEEGNQYRQFSSSLKEINNG